MRQRPQASVPLLIEVDDPRWLQARLHAWEDFILIANLAVICGADRGAESELFGRHKHLAETFLVLPHGTLSHGLFGHVFARWAPTAGSPFHTLGTVAGDGPQGPSRFDGRQDSPPFPRCRPEHTDSALGRHLVLSQFQGDESRIRTDQAVRSMSILRWKTTAKGGIATRSKQVGWNDGYLLKVLSNQNAIALSYTVWKGCIRAAIVIL